MKLSRLKNLIRQHGIRSGAVLTVDRLLKREVREIDYGKWMDRNRLSSRDYARMEKRKLSFYPMFGVSARMDKKDRTDFVQSLGLQVYSNFCPYRERVDVEYVLVVSGPCTLKPEFFWECAASLQESAGDKIDLVYFDSDVVGRDGRKGDPAFRPEYDPVLLSQVNYMGCAVLVSRDAVLRAGLPQEDGDEAFYDFLKRVVSGCEGTAGKERSGRVRHIPKILYHEMRPHGAQEYTGGAEEENAQDAESFGENMPLISVLIPNKDHREDLDRCIRSLEENNTWKNLEILVIENNSEREDTFDFYRTLNERDPRVRILTYNGSFNYSAVNNFGAREAKGEYLLFLNNDTQILRPDSVRCLYEAASMPGTGAAGALLMYPDGTVQHGGIILGYGGIAGHAWQGEKIGEREDTFPELVFSHMHSVSAVTGACMMMSTEKFTRAGGFDEALEVTFNDVDLCLRLREMGERIVMCPDAVLVHYESASRGSEDSPGKVARFHREIGIFARRWENRLREGDPFYNPNLSLLGRSWSCRDELRENVKPYLKYMQMAREMEEETDL